MSLTVVAAVNVCTVVVTVIRVIAATLAGTGARAETLPAFRIRSYADAVTAEVIATAVAVIVTSIAWVAVGDASAFSIAMCPGRTDRDALTVHAGQALVDIADHRRVAALTRGWVAGPRTGEAGGWSRAGHRSVRAAGGRIAEVVGAKIAVVAIHWRIDAVPTLTAGEVVPD